MFELFSAASLATVATMIQTNSSLHHVYNDNLNWLRSLIFRRMGCNELAADLAQDAFLRLLKKPQTFDSSDGARAWLSRVAQGLCIDYWRRQEVEQAWLETLAAKPEDVAPSPEQQAILLETLYELDSMLHTLPEKVMRAFLLSQLHGLAYRDIAQQLGVSERMVKYYMAQAMTHCLRIQMELEMAQSRA